MTASEIIQIVLGILSLLATIAVSFLIYWLQSRHEKEIRDIEAKRDQKELEEKAHVFLSKNSDERDYLPWCIIAANLHRHEAHTRKIYTNYCRCSAELQAEILKQAGFSLQPIVSTDWLSSCFMAIEEDRKRYNLGRNYLYDGAKYFHRAFSRYRNYKYELDEIYGTNVYINETFTQARFEDSKYDFMHYFDEYFRYAVGEIQRHEINENNLIPPYDWLWKTQNLGSISEEKMCFWTMESVFNLAVNVYNRLPNQFGELLFGNATDARAETFEDRYYETLLWVYYTYYKPKRIEKERIPKMKVNSLGR